MPTPVVSKPSPAAQLSLAGLREGGAEFRDMPIQTREAPIVSASKADRTASLVWTTGARVKRYDWWNDRSYWEELSLDPAHVRMGRLSSGTAPVLDTHSRWNLSSVLGVVTTAALAGTEGTCEIRFSKRDSVEPIFQDVEDGILKNVSVGYSVHKVERIAPATEGDLWIYRAVDWEPFEVSLVPVGADPDCGVRSDTGEPLPNQTNLRTWSCEFVDRVPSSPAAAGTPTTKERAMPPEDNINPAAASQAQQEQERAAAVARAEGARQESERQAGIRELVTIGGLEAAYAEQLVGQRDLTVAEAGMAILREKAKRDAATPARSAADIQTISDETEQRRAAIGDAIVLRANPRAIKDAPRLAAARQYRGMDLMDMAREAVHLVGGNTRGFSKREVAVMALNLDPDLRARAGMHSTSDFPNLLAGTINRTLRAAYELQPRTFVGWARQSSAPDFRQVARVQLSESSVFQKVGEGGEYKAITFGESAEKYSLGKYGGIVALTWESVINDDLGAFDRIPLALAAEAAALEGDIVYGILNNNLAMSDGVNLFATQHGNVAASGSAITDVTLGEARAAMRKQTGLKGRVLNLTPTFLIVGPDNEGAANKYTSSQFVAAKSVDINPSYNTSLEVVVDPRIAGNAWYLAATPSLVDTVEFAYLEGEDGLYTEQRQGFEVDGVQIKARHVFAAKAIDWRGIRKNAGA